MEKRISRIAFNTNGWIMPSGSYGKSANKDSYEFQFGFGHEEWLFDVSKLIDGYHYGFLEPIRKFQQTYAGNKYHVWLYTIDRISKKRYWVGEISKIEVLDKKEADFALRYYQRKGWYSDMENQVISAGGDKNAFANWHDVDLFNIRFKPKNLKVNDPYVVLPSHSPLFKLNRYNFINFLNSYKVEDDKEFKFLPGYKSEFADSDSEVETKSHIREQKSIEITYLHNTISQKLTSFLKQKYGKNKVSTEHPTGIGGSRIDIVLDSSSEGLVFYEIKTYNSLKTSIREAFGQLMEYAFYPDRLNASQLIILTQKHSKDETEEVSKFLQHIRDNFNIPIYHQWYDYETNKLSKKF